MPGLPLRNDLYRLLRVGSSGVAELTGLTDLDPMKKDKQILKNGPKNYMNVLTNDIINWKKGEERSVIENEHTERGKKYENAILDFFTEITGKQVTGKQHAFSASEPFFEKYTICKVDGLVEENGIEVPLEVKCPEKLYEEIPFSHYVQVQFQMWCMGPQVQHGYYLAMTIDKENECINKSSFILLTVLRDESLIDQLKERILFMFENYVTENKIPEKNEIFPYHGFVPKVKIVEIDSNNQDQAMD